MKLDYHERATPSALSLICRMKKMSARLVYANRADKKMFSTFDADYPPKLSKRIMSSSMPRL